MSAIPKLTWSPQSVHQHPLVVRKAARPKRFPTHHRSENLPKQPLEAEVEPLAYLQPHFRAFLKYHITFLSQPGQELMSALSLPLASVVLIQPPIPRSASMVPRKPPLGSGVSASRSFSSSSPPPVVQLWVTSKQNDKFALSHLCYSCHQTPSGAEKLGLCTHGGESACWWHLPQQLFIS